MKETVSGMIILHDAVRKFSDKLYAIINGKVDKIVWDEFKKIGVSPDDISMAASHLRNYADKIRKAYESVEINF